MSVAVENMSALATTAASAATTEDVVVVAVKKAPPRKRSKATKRSSDDADSSGEVTKKRPSKESKKRKLAKGEQPPPLPGMDEPPNDDAADAPRNFVIECGAAVAAADVEMAEGEAVAVADAPLIDALVSPLVDDAPSDDAPLAKKPQRKRGKPAAKRGADAVAVAAAAANNNNDDADVVADAVDQDESVEDDDSSSPKQARSSSVSNKASVGVLVGHSEVRSRQIFHKGRLSLVKNSRVKFEYNNISGIVMPVFNSKLTSVVYASDESSTSFVILLVAIADVIVEDNQLMAVIHTCTCKN